MRELILLIWPLGLWLLACLLALWDRRQVRELGSFLLAFLLGGVGGGLYPWPPFGMLRNYFFPSQLAWDSLSLVLWVLLITVFLARWPSAETVLDSVWIGTSTGAGLGLGLTLSGALGKAGTSYWLVVAGPVVGSSSAMLWGWRRHARQAWQRLVALLGALLVGWGVGCSIVLLGSYFEERWPGWVAAFSWGVLSFSLGMVLETEELRVQLVEEAHLGLFPLWVVDSAARWVGRVGKKLAPRRDERRAIARVLVRVAACKAYLSFRGKKQSAASVELGRLREWLRRVFGGAGDATEFSFGSKRLEEK